MIPAALTVLSWVRRAAAAMIRAVVEHPWQFCCLVLGCASLLLWNGKREALADLAVMTKARDAEIAAHQKTKSDYRSAQAAAAELDLQNIARVKQEQTAALNQVEKQYANDLSSARARSEEHTSELKSIKHIEY